VLIAPSHGNPASRAWFAATLAREVTFTQAPLKDCLASSELDMLLRLHPHGTARFWGAPTHHDAKMDQLATGDVILFTGENRVQAVGKIGCKLRNKALADALWKPDATIGRFSWSNGYSVLDFRRVQHLTYSDIQAAAGYSPNDMFQGIRVSSPHRAAALISALSLDADEQREENSPAKASEDIGIVLVKGRLRMVSVTPNGTIQCLGEYNQSHSILLIESLKAHAWKSAADELEELINSPCPTERRFQDFFERNPHFLYGDMYAEARPHILLQRVNAGPLIPDFVLRPHDPHALCDLLELKLPSARLVVGNNNRKRLSAAASEACAQLREYRDYFEVLENRKAIEAVHNLRFFRPRLIVIIGRRNRYPAIDLRKAETDVPNLTITTYDDLIERARSRMRFDGRWRSG
jgi:hypothetical protein